MEKKVYLETANTLPVYDECEILIIGGGAAGHSAAIAAARAGAKDIILMERYGYMGGDVTGGYVIMVPDLSWYNMSFVRGLQEEWFTRLDKNAPGSVLAPSLDKLGSEDPALLYRWAAIHDCVSRGTHVSKGPNGEEVKRDTKRLVRAVYFEPNQLKIEMDKMLYEHRDAIKVLYHSWGTKPIMEGNEVKGVIFESKEGRQAILAKTVIDATGDGDLYVQTGAPYSSLADGETRSSTTAVVWRVGGINWDQYYEWSNAHPNQVAAMKARMAEIAGFRNVPLPSNDNSICWINNWHAAKDCTKVKDLTATEINTRITMREILAYMKEACPFVFRNAYIYDIAPQLGTRCSRRLKGEYIMSANDWAFANQFDDTIAWHSTICQINDCGPVEIPYRAILPQNIENMLAPGRHLSSDDVAIDWLNLIPQCVGTGQAAGVAAAVAAKDGTNVRNVDIKKVQNILIDQDVPLPRNSRVDKAYMQCVEEHMYGTYTELAKKARAEADGLKSFRQW